MEKCGYSKPTLLNKHLNTWKFG